MPKVNMIIMFLLDYNIICLICTTYFYFVYTIVFSQQKAGFLSISVQLTPVPISLSSTPFPLRWPLLCSLYLCVCFGLVCYFILFYLCMLVCMYVCIYLFFIFLTTWIFKWKWWQSFIKNYLTYLEYCF